MATDDAARSRLTQTDHLAMKCIAYVLFAHQKVHFMIVFQLRLCSFRYGLDNAVHGPIEFG